MYTLILYDDENNMLDYYRNLNDVYADEDNVYWNDGFLEGIQVNFIIIEGDLEFEEGTHNVSELINSDIKTQLLSEQKKQQKQYVDMQNMINMMLLDPKDFEQDNEMMQMQTIINEMMLSSL